MIINYVEKFPNSKVYFFNKIISDQLIYRYLQIPITKDKRGRLGFRKTEELEEILNKMGFLLKIISLF